MLDLASIPTHYYKMAHICTINYFIYTSPKSNGDQSLLELELFIRYNHPRILVTYHNKSLYYFTFGPTAQHQVTPKNEDLVMVDAVPEIVLEFDLAKEYPSLQLKNSGVISLDENTATRDEQTPFASFSFLKAYKKMVHYTLSMNGALKIFGNQALVQWENKYVLFLLDPSLHPSGDLLLSAVTKTSIELYSTDSLDPNTNPNDFVVYLAPSGIRCHLFDPTLLSRNLITKKNDTNENLLNLIKSSTGVDYTHTTPLSDEMVWVKLIPNLKHLNNQTSTIANFVHTVDNKKFILWLWKLCFIQKGVLRDIQEKTVTQDKLSNPLALMSRFLDFQVSLREQNKAQTAQSNETLNHYQPGSLMSVSTGNGSLVETPADIETDNLFAQEEQRVQADENDDLFGDGSDEDKGSTQDEESENRDHLAEKLNGDESAASIPEPSRGEEIIDTNPELVEVNKLEPQNNILTGLANNAHVISPKPKPYLNIPKDQMMMRKWNTPDYNDPGAPAPVVPTPSTYQAINTLSGHNLWSQNTNFVPQTPAGAPTQTVHTGTSPISPPKSVFSPILFNPIIKSDIDTKYGKGGKFYVHRELLADPEQEQKRRNVRATSVSGFEPVKKDQLGLHTRVFEESLSEESDVDESPGEVDETHEQNKDASNSSQLVSNDFQNCKDLEELTSYTGSQPPSLALPLPEELLSASRALNGKMSNVTTSQSTPSNTLGGSSTGQMFNNGSFGPFSPLDFDTPQPQWPGTPIPKETNVPEPADTTESTNYLPLILRSINVGSIPKVFYLNNTKSPALDYEELEEDLFVNENEVDEILTFLLPQLIYSNEHSLNSGEKGGAEPIDHITAPIFSELRAAFPRCHSVNLTELLISHKLADEEDPQLNFLDDITTDDDLLNPRAQYKKLRAFEWDDSTGDEEYARYLALKEQYYSRQSVGEEQFFALPSAKITAMKNSSIVNLDSSAVKFWRLLNFSPASPRNSQCLLICEEHIPWNPHELLDQIFQNYRECNFGDISRVKLGDINGVCTGTQVLNHLEHLASLIKQDLLGKGNMFDFGRPLLLLFADLGRISPLRQAKIALRFACALKKEQLPLVDVFTATIHLKSGSNLRYFAGHTLSKLLMNIYNRWPQALKPFAHLARDPPDKIGFKFLKDVTVTDDIFLHLAYERSIDKHWSSAAWSDPLGVAIKTKLWYHGTIDLAAVCDDIWKISSEMFRKLSDERALGGKKFLVLTRVNNILLDDELVHWKRLSLKHRDISMIVLTVNDAPLRIFGKVDQKKESAPKMLSKPGKLVSNSSPPITSPVGFSFHLPQQFYNVPNFLLPGDAQGAPTTSLTLLPQLADCIVNDPRSNLIGVVPRSPLLLFNYLTRVGMKTGYLMKEDSDTAGYLVLEVNMLSCSSYWDLDVLMKLVLGHYKKLAALGDVMGVHGGGGLIPWHVLAVRKCLGYLVHVLVGKKDTVTERNE